MTYHLMKKPEDMLKQRLDEPDSASKEILLLKHLNLPGMNLLSQLKWRRNTE